MTYSKKRLMALCVLWLAAGAMIFTGSTDVVESPLNELDQTDLGNPLLEEAFGANNANDNSCPNDNGPCAYPAENYNGGIVLGASYLDAANGGLTYFNPDTASGSSGDEQLDTKYLPPGAADKGQSTIPAITVGLDVNEVSDFFLYKTWKTGNAVPNHDDAYIFIQTDSATLDGPSPNNNAGCRSSPYVKQHCDLVGKVNELSAGGLCFGGSSTGYSDTAAYFRETRYSSTEYTTTQCSDLADDETGEFPDSGCAVRDDLDCEDIGYWVEDPEEDKCEINQIANLETTLLVPSGVDIVGFCLSAADPEATFDFVIEFDFSVDTIEIDDLLIRSHRLVAEKGPDSGQNKVLELGEAGNPDNNFYAEIRWGKGYDRATWPESNIRYYDWLDNEANPGSPLSDQTRVAGLANPFPCRGNPTAEDQGWATAGGTTDENTRCVVQPENEGTLDSGAYDDIYR